MEIPRLGGFNSANNSLCVCAFCRFRSESALKTRLGTEGEFAAEGVGTVCARRRTKTKTPMLVIAKNHQNETNESHTSITLSDGLIGLPEIQTLEIMRNMESWPFITLRSPEPGGLQFLAIEPHDFIPDYIIELNDIDTEVLGVERVEDALVLNIVTVHSIEPQFVTTNLIGPVIINRITRKARQVIISNSDQYSARHVLVDERD